MLSLIELALREIEAGQSGARRRILGLELNRSLELLAFFVMALLRAVEGAERHMRGDGGWIHRERFFKTGFGLLVSARTLLKHNHVQQCHGIVRSGVDSFAAFVQSVFLISKTSVGVGQKDFGVNISGVGAKNKQGAFLGRLQPARTKIKFSKIQLSWPVGRLQINRP